MQNPEKSVLEDLAGKFISEAALSRERRFSEAVELLTGENTPLKDYLVLAGYIEKTSDLGSPYRITRPGRKCAADYLSRQEATSA